MPDEIDQLRRDLSAAQLRNDRLRAEMMALQQALASAQTLISAAVEAGNGAVVSPGVRPERCVRPENWVR